jgi:hypothetical protein
MRAHILVFSNYRKKSAMLVLSLALTGCAVKPSPGTPNVTAHSDERASSVGLEAKPRPQFVQLPAQRNTGASAASQAVNCLVTPLGLECFAQEYSAGGAAGNPVITARFAGGQWSEWTNLGGVIISNVSCFSPGPTVRDSRPDSMSCFATGQNDNLWILKREGGIWSSDWQQAPAHPIRDDITCQVAPFGAHAKFFCFARDRSSHLVYSSWRIPDPRSHPSLSSGWNSWREVEPQRYISGGPRCSVSGSGSGSGSSTVWAICDVLHGANEVRRWRGGVENSAQATTEWSVVGSAVPAWVVEEGSQHRPTSCVVGSRGGACFYIGGNRRLWRLDTATGVRTEIEGTETLLPDVRCVVSGNIHCLVRNGARNVIHYEIAP